MSIHLSELFPPLTYYEVLRKLQAKNKNIT